MREHYTIDIMIMAAGEGSRMGSIKQLLAWKDSNFLLDCVQKANRSIADSVHIVLGAHAVKIIDVCSFKQHQTPNILINYDWPKGLGNSISFGLKRVMDSDHKPDAILICLADQPLVSISYLNKLITTFKKSNHNIIATQYKNRAGVPALFDKSVYQNLEKLDGDFGAKHVLKQLKKETLVLVEKEIIRDIDTKAEYLQLQNEFQIKNLKDNGH